jgi:hypothetical protein
MNNLTNIFSYTHPHNGSEELILRQLHNVWEIGLQSFEIDAIGDGLGIVIERQKMFGNAPMYSGTYTEIEPDNKARPHISGMSIARVNLAGFSAGSSLKQMIKTLFHELQHHIQYRDKLLTNYKSYWRNATEGRGETEAKPAKKVYKATFNGKDYGYQTHDLCPWEQECDQVAAQKLTELVNNGSINRDILGIRIPEQEIRRRKMKRIEFDPFK